MKRITACYVRIFTTLIIITGFLMLSSTKVNAAENIVIVIDPGHGGDNLGAEPGTFYEKDSNLITAKAMKAELEKYDNVKVYMTREDDKALTLDERAAFAASVHADFLYSLHYNMSLNHYFYGAEVWAQSAGENYTKGYSFGQVLLADFQNNFGILSRGVKVKVNNRGKDYYGVLRASQALQIPAVIIEHCHLDNQEDAEFYATSQTLQDFGKADAVAVAKYFGLTSSVLGTEFKNYAKFIPDIPTSPKIQDLTVPEICLAEVIDYDSKTGNLNFKISSEDKDSGILYYSYSLDNGTTWSPLYIWPSAVGTVKISVKSKSSATPFIIARSFNSYDGMAVSQSVKYN